MMRKKGKMEIMTEGKGGERSMKREKNINREKIIRKFRKRRKEAEERKN